MRSQNVIREYRMSDSELCLLTAKICMFLTRDLTDLQDFGVTAQKITDLKTLANEFEYFPDDEYYLVGSMEATEAKNQILAQLKEAYRMIVLRFSMTWGDDSLQLRRVAASEYYSAPEGQLITMARKTHIYATENLAKLAPAGLTQEQLNEFKQLTDDLLSAIIAQEEAIDIRDNKATERGNKGNEIYKLLASYCDIGKRFYLKSDPSKYNDYVIYSPSAGGLKPPTGLKYLVEHYTAVWDAVENATSYELQYSPDEKTWSEAYGGADNMVHYFPPQGGLAFFRCRARNANGFVEYSEVLKTEIPMPS